MTMCHDVSEVKTVTNENGDSLPFGGFGKTEELVPQSEDWFIARGSLLHLYYKKARDFNTSLEILEMIASTTRREDVKRLLLANTGAPSEIRARWVLEWGMMG